MLKNKLFCNFFVKTTWCIVIINKISKYQFPKVWTCALIKTRAEWEGHTLVQVKGSRVSLLCNAMYVLSIHKKISVCVSERTPIHCDLDIGSTDT